MTNRLVTSLKYRTKLARFGIYFLRSNSRNFSRICIHGCKIKFAFLKEEQGVMEHELQKILFDDCYKLEQFRRPIQKVLDIGANAGLFSIAARYHFPNATVHAYEPNTNLRPQLDSHLTPIDVKYFLQAVGKETGSISLRFGENSLHSVVDPTNLGSIPQIAFRDALSNLGTPVDLVKLDCEGAEWAIFQDQESWAKVKHLTMEYHLWAGSGHTIDELMTTVRNLGFTCWHHEPSTSGGWGLLQASKQ